MSNIKKSILFSFLILLGFGKLFAQDSTFVLSSEMFNERGFLRLPDLNEWHFKEGNDTTWAESKLNDTNWQKLDSTKIANIKVDDNGLFECWFRIKIKLDSSLLNTPIYLNQYSKSATDIYINGKLVHSFGNTNVNKNQFRTNNLSVDLPPNLSLTVNDELVVAVHFVDLRGSLYNLDAGRVLYKKSFLSFVNSERFNKMSENKNGGIAFFSTVISILGVLVFLFWILAFLNRSQSHLIYIAITVSFILSVPGLNLINWYVLDSSTSNIAYFLNQLDNVRMVGLSLSLLILIAMIFTNRIPRALKMYVLFGAIISLLIIPYPIIAGPTSVIITLLSVAISLYYPISQRKKLKGSKWVVVVGLVLTILIMSLFGLLFNVIKVEGIHVYRLHFLIAQFLVFPLSLLVYVAFWLKEMIVDIQQKATELIQVTEEKREILKSQNEVLESQVKERTHKLSQSLENLKSVQSQLIQSEKMASLGELTAGIAHEIQNPLNFVNNFSEVSEELLEELEEEIENNSKEDIEAIITDLKQNLNKINHHGERASSIVKGMLDHSRTSSGQKELTDINLLADEYLRLSYHGLRAKDKSFNADFKTEFDKNIQKIEVIPQDIGRVMLNLINNAFYAVDKKVKKRDQDYKPIVIVSTKKLDNSIEISVKDNGDGIPKDIVNKIFQPFFTTKPTGQGTGLGLSLSYDIVKAHGGELKVESTEGVGTEFIIQLLIKN